MILIFVFWASFLFFTQSKKSYSECLRRTQIRWVIWRSSIIIPVVAFHFLDSHMLPRQELWTKPGGGSHFFEKVPDCVQILSGMFTVGPSNRPRKKKRTNQKSPDKNRESLPKSTRKGQIETDEPESQFCLRASKWKFKRNCITSVFREAPRGVTGHQNCETKFCEKIGAFLFKGH